MIVKSTKSIFDWNSSEDNKRRNQIAPSPPCSRSRKRAGISGAPANDFIGFLQHYAPVAFVRCYRTERRGYEGNQARKVRRIAISKRDCNLDGLAGRTKYLNTAGVWDWQSSALAAVGLSDHPKPAIGIT